MVKNPPANAGDRRDVDSIPGSGKIPRRRAGRPISVFRGVWWATVHGVARSGTLLKRLSRQGTWYLGRGGCRSVSLTTVSKRENPRGGDVTGKVVLFARFQTKRPSFLSSGLENYKSPSLQKKKKDSKAYSNSILIFYIAQTYKFLRKRVFC